MYISEDNQFFCSKSAVFSLFSPVTTEYVSFIHYETRLREEDCIEHLPIQLYAHLANKIVVCIELLHGNSTVPRPRNMPTILTPLIFPAVRSARHDVLG